jgi:hypothetical protein
MVGQVLRFEPYADHLQFVVSDAEADWGQFDGDTWVKALTEWRIGVERHAVAVAAARYDYVPVILNFWTALLLTPCPTTWATLSRRISRCRPAG